MTDWLTTEEAAAYLKVHPKTLYRYVRAGKLRQYNPGGRGHPRFLVEELDAFLRDASAPGASSSEETPRTEPVQRDQVAGARAIEQKEDASRDHDSELAEPSEGPRRRRRGLGFGSGFPLAPPQQKPERGEVLRDVLQQVEDLGRRCEELRLVVVNLLEQEEAEAST